MGLADILIFLVGGLYLLSTVLFLTGIGAGNARLKKVGVGGAALGFLLHTVSLVLPLASDSALAFSSASFHLRALAWAVLLTYFFLRGKLRLEFLGVAALPLTLLLTALSLISGGIRVVMPPHWANLFFGLHIVTLALSLGIMAMACGAGFCFLHYNRKLKTKAGLKSLGKDTPSLHLFDRVNHMAASFGFPLYTLGLGASFFWYWISPQKAFSWDIMKFASLAVWVLFAILFHNRVILGWKGRKPAVLAISVFFLMVVALVHHTITFKS